MLIHQMIKWGLNKHENWYKKNVMVGQSRFGEPVTHLFAILVLPNLTFHKIFYIILKIDFCLGCSYSMQENQDYCFVHPHSVSNSAQPSFPFLFSLKIAEQHVSIYKKTPSKPKVWRLSHCLNVIYKIAQQIKQHYENI